jgi:hypothetical protein
MKKTESAEISQKSTKEQILSAYHEVLEKLNERQPQIPQEAKKKEEERSTVVKAASLSSDGIISSLSGIKLKAIKQLDTLSEELLEEFEKLSGLREAISLEQKHLEELYQIKETANTLAALLQAHSEQKEKLQRERDQEKEGFELFMADQRSRWKEENASLEREFKEKQEKQERDRAREEEEYVYAQELKRRKEMDDYDAKKAALEKELMEMQEGLQKRESALSEKEKLLSDLQARVEQFPEELRKAVEEAEERLRTQILQEHGFESQIQKKEQEGLVKLHGLQVTSLQGKIKEQEALIKELSQKADQAAENVQLIACRALDASSQRFMPVLPAVSDDRTATSQK